MCCSLSAYKRTSAAVGKLARTQMPTQTAKSPHAAHKHSLQPKKGHPSCLANTLNAQMILFAHIMLPECPQTHLGCRWEARARVNADINRPTPARRAQTLAAAQERQPQQPCKHPTRSNELVFLTPYFQSTHKGIKAVVGRSCACTYRATAICT